jgi:tetratricopeptide (TPR) repeat protein
MSALEQARSQFEAGRYSGAREAAVQGLEERPDDVQLLRLAGRAGVESGAGDAVDHLRRVTELEPASAQAWRDLADALAAEGRSEDADAAFGKVLELEPEDETALTARGHTAFQAGRRDDAVALLERVARRSEGATTAHVSLVEMYRVLGKPEEAAGAARLILDAEPDNRLAALDLAEMSLAAGKLQDALDAFGRLRDNVDLPDDEVAALHGTIRIELALGNDERALELAREAGAIDTVGRTTAVLTYLETHACAGEPLQPDLARGQSMAFIQALEAPPSRAEVEAMLDATLADLRATLVQDDRQSAGNRG